MKRREGVRPQWRRRQYSHSLYETLVPISKARVLFFEHVHFLLASLMVAFKWQEQSRHRILHVLSYLMQSAEHVEVVAKCRPH